MADHIIDLAIYRAILHGAAAGACSVAARETGSAYWAATAREQSGKAAERLHQAALPERLAWALASTSRVTPRPALLE